MAQSPRITVSMMVKNEEELLPQALESIKDFASEIVVVDTGSEDRTVEIAESYGAKIYHHPWENSFAKHRNQTIDYATGDWIFILDADEQLDLEGVAILKEAIKNENTNVISIPVHSIMGSTQEGSSHNSIRMFRSNLGIRYEGAVHNEVVYTGEATFFPAKLYHYGYDLSREKMIAKFKRTTEMLLNEMENDPENPKWPHYLAVSYYTEKFFSESLAMAKKSIELCHEDPKTLERWIGNFYLAAACKLNFDDLEGSQETITQVLDIYEDYIDAWAVQTSIDFGRGDSEKLLKSSNKYLELRERYQTKPASFKTIPLHTLNHSHLVLVRLAMDAKKQDNEQGFREYFAKAKSVAQNPAEVVENIATYLDKTGDIDAAVEIIENNLSEFPGNKLLAEKLVKLLLKQGKFDHAKMAIQTTLQSGLDKNTGRFLEGLLYLVSTDYQQAFEIFDSLIKDDSQNVDAYINMGISLEQLERLDEAEKAYLEAIDLCPEKLDSAINLGQLYSRNNKPNEAIAFLEQVTLADDSLFDIHLLLTRLYWDIDNVDKMVSRAVHVGQKLNVEIKDTLESAADLAEIFNQVGIRLVAINIAKAAAVALEMAKNLAPDNWEIHLNFGNVLLLMKDPTRALQAFEQAARISPDQWQVFEALGRCYTEIGSNEAAEMCEKKVAELKNK